MRRAGRSGRGAGTGTNGHRAHRKQKTTPDPGVTNECGLVAYRTRAAARHALRRKLRGKQLRERRCETCDLFHHFRLDESIIRGQRTAGERFGMPLTFSADRTSGPAPKKLGLTPARIAEILTPKCVRCDKRIYPDQQAATLAADYFTALYGKPYRVYPQKSCDGWHVTSLLTKAERRANKERPIVAQAPALAA